MGSFNEYPYAARPELDRRLAAAERAFAVKEGGSLALDGDEEPAKTVQPVSADPSQEQAEDLDGPELRSTRSAASRLANQQAQRRYRARRKQHETQLERRVQTMQAQAKVSQNTIKVQADEMKNLQKHMVHLERRLKAAERAADQAESNRDTCTDKLNALEGMLERKVADHAAAVPELQGRPSSAASTATMQPAFEFAQLEPRTLQAIRAPAQDAGHLSSLPPHICAGLAHFQGSACEALHGADPFDSALALFGQSNEQAEEGFDLGAWLASDHEAMEARTTSPPPMHWTWGAAEGALQRQADVAHMCRLTT